MEIMDKINELNKLKYEFLELGLELGLIDKSKANDVGFRLNKIRISIDDLLPSSVLAITRKFDDVHTVFINPKNRIYKDEKLRDEVVFSEIAHIINEIHSDLFIYSRSQIYEFSTENKDLKKGNDLLGWPTFGVSLLDECISHYVSKTMVNKKYNINETSKEYVVDRPFPPRKFYHDNNSDYENKIKLAEVFSKTLYSGEDSMKKLCRDSLSDCFLDKMFAKYSSRKDGKKELYEILGFMGEYNMALLAKKGYENEPVQTTNIVDKNNEENAELAKTYFLQRTNGIIIFLINIIFEV